MSTTPSAATKPAWLAGVTQAIPIVLGYVPIGVAFGVLAQKAGISTLNTVLMSLIVFAGSSQLIAVGLFAAGVAAFAYQLTDETFAVHAARFASASANKAEAFATNVTAQAAWVFGGWLGMMLGQAITDVKSLALDYVLPAMFIALMVLQIKDRVQVGVALVTGALSVILLLMGVGQWNVIAATLIGATVGVVLETWIKKPSS